MSFVKLRSNQLPRIMRSIKNHLERRGFKVKGVQDVSANAVRPLYYLDGMHEDGTLVTLRVRIREERPLHKK